MGLNDNKSPWAKGASVNTETAPLLDSIVDRKFATQYLAERLPEPYDNLRNLRHRIGQKIKTAIETGQLKTVNGQYTFGDLTTWARSRTDFAPAVADIVIPVTGSVNIVAPAFTLSAIGISLPPALQDCQAALADAYRELNTLREENIALRASVANLTPLQTKAVARSETAKQAGKQGGRGNKK
jgi:hypothetical protein